MKKNIKKSVYVSLLGLTMIGGSMFPTTLASASELQKTPENQQQQTKLADFISLTGRSQTVGNNFATIVTGVVKLTSTYNVQLEYLDANRTIITSTIPELQKARVDRKFTNEVKTSVKISYVKAYIKNSSGVIQEQQEIYIP